MSDEWNKRYRISLISGIGLVAAVLILIIGLGIAPIDTIPPNDIFVDSLCEFSDGRIGFFLNDGENAYTKEDAQFTAEIIDGKDILHIKLKKPVLFPSRHAIPLENALKQKYSSAAYWTLGVSPDTESIHDDEEYHPLSEIRISGWGTSKTLWKEGDKLPQKSDDLLPEN